MTYIKQGQKKAHKATVPKGTNAITLELNCETHKVNYPLPPMTQKETR
ncbi:hypothetical protein ACSAZL_01075 [Methanosarcina sp. T3]